MRDDRGVVLRRLRESEAVVPAGEPLLEVADPADLEIRWVTIPAGYGFTAGQPSTTSLVIRSVPPGWPQEQRVAFMKSVCDLWQEVTGCTLNEIVVSAYDGPLPV